MFIFISTNQRLNHRLINETHIYTFKYF